MTKPRRPETPLQRSYKRGLGIKLIIQIPCLNEEETLGITLQALPRTVPGFEEVEWLIIDDGSTDRTIEVARQNGVDHIARHIRNRGLSYAFMTGINSCLALGADVIVNTDADNQYKATDIPLLTAPILAREADMVIGARPIAAIEHFTPIKKVLQRLGSWAVRVISQTDVSDAPSGFRAISREAAQQLVVFNNYTYTLETIIQAGQKNLQIVNVPISVNEDLRPSRVVKSIPSYVRRSILTMLRIFVIYRPARVFGTVAILFLAIGFLVWLRFLYFWLAGDGDGHVQSLILGAALIIMGFQTLLTAILADVISANRRLLEELRYVQRSSVSSGKVANKADHVDANQASGRSKDKK